MIIVEDRLPEIFNTLPVMTISNSDYKPEFGLGSIEDLIKHLNERAKTGEKYYPLIWLETPFETVGNEKKVTAPLKLVLATLNKDKSMSNAKRLEVTFKPTLIPLHANIITAFNQSGFTRILNPNEIKATNFFNHGFKEELTKKDVWDARKFQLELEMTDGMIQKIIY